MHQTHNHIQTNERMRTKHQTLSLFKCCWNSLKDRVTSDWLRKKKKKNETCKGLHTVGYCRCGWREGRAGNEAVTVITDHRPIIETDIWLQTHFNTLNSSFRRTVNTETTVLSMTHSSSAAEDLKWPHIQYCIKTLDWILPRSFYLPITPLTTQYTI